MPLTVLLKSKLEAERHWLEHQAIFRPGWEQGCAAIACILDTWVEEYAGQILRVDLTEGLREGCGIRVWSAWAYHWERAQRRSSSGEADGMAVADAVRAGIRVGHPHPMGGDPFRDAVLVEGCLAGLNPALGRFFTEFQVTFNNEMRRFLHREPDSELCEDLFVKLVGPAPERPKIIEFRGYSSLRSWLRPVVRHFAQDRYRLDQIRRLAEQKAASRHAATVKPSNSVEWCEALERCRVQVVRAVGSLEERDRLLLLLRYRSGWSGIAIASLLGIHPGHFSRLLGQATEHLRHRLEAQWEQLFDQFDSSAIAYFLLRGLDEVQPEERTLESHRMTQAEELVMGTAHGKSKKKTASKKPAKSKGKLYGHIVKPRSRHSESKKPTWRKGPSLFTLSTSEEPMREVRPEELERFLPEKVDCVMIGDAPEDLFLRLETRPEGERPAVVCLDAREEPNLDRVLPWLERFDAVVTDQYEDKNEARNPYEPHRAVFLGKRVPELPADWKTWPDVDWVQTEDTTSEVTVLYLRHLRKDLTDFVNEGLEGFFPAATPGGKSERLADLIPTSKRDAWNARVKEFQEREDEA